MDHDYTSTEVIFLSPRQHSNHQIYIKTTVADKLGGSMLNQLKQLAGRRCTYPKTLVEYAHPSTCHSFIYCAGDYLPSHKILQIERQFSYYSQSHLTLCYLVILKKTQHWSWLIRFMTDSVWRMKKLVEHWSA